MDFRYLIMRSVPSTEIANFHYPKHEVLADQHAQFSRLLDLKSATAMTNMEHEEIGIIVQLENGEEVEILSTMIDVEAKYVEVKGGHLIPISAILRVEI